MRLRCAERLLTRFLLLLLLLLLLLRFLLLLPWPAMGSDTQLLATQLRASLLCFPAVPAGAFWTCCPWGPSRLPAEGTASGGRGSAGTDPKPRTALPAMPCSL